MKEPDDVVGRLYDATKALKDVFVTLFSQSPNGPRTSHARRLHDEVAAFHAEMARQERKARGVTR